MHILLGRLVTLMLALLKKGVLDDLKCVMPARHAEVNTQLLVPKHLM